MDRGKASMRKLVVPFVVSLLLVAACKSTEAPSGSGAATPATGGTAGTTEVVAVVDDRAPGVTGDTIKIGVTYPDFAALGDAVSINHGDYEAAYSAVIDDINAKGGVAGRKLEAVFAPVDPSSATSTDETCTTLTQDEHVFIAMGLFYGEAVLCYVSVNETAVLGGEMTDDRLAQARAPWFAYDLSSDAQVDGVQELIDSGDLTGSVAVLLTDTDQAVYEDRIKPVLDEAGIEVVETGVMSTALDPDQIPGESRTMLQRFEASNAETVLALGQGTANIVADGLAGSSYRPKLLFNSTNGVNAFTRDATRDATVFDGAIGVGVFGPLDAIYDMGGATEECFELQRAAGLTINRPSTVAPGEPNQLVSSLAACQQLALLTAILEGAGEDLNYGTFTTAGHELGEIQLPGESELFTYGPPPSADGDRPLHRFVFDGATRVFVQAS